MALELMKHHYITYWFVRSFPRTMMGVAGTKEIYVWL